MSPHETTELVPERELYELFERRRPQRDTFRAGIEERIAARREADASDGEDEDGPVLSSFWRRAAAFLPIDPIGGGVAGSAAGKVLGGKLLPAALALPAMVLASVFGGFLAGKRSLRRSTADAAPFDPTARRRAMKLGSPEYRALGPSRMLVSLIQFATILAFLVAWLFGGALALDVLTLVLVFSMAALVVMVRSLAALYVEETGSTGSKMVAARVLTSLGGHMQAGGQTRSVEKVKMVHN